MLSVRAFLCRIDVRRVDRGGPARPGPRVPGDAVVAHTLPPVLDRGGNTNETGDHSVRRRALAHLADRSQPSPGRRGAHGQLNGFEETPNTLNTEGTGVFLGLISDAPTEIQFNLFYTGMTGNVLFAHIHFGKPGESGGVAAFLCGGGGKPACLASGEVVVGVVTAADVVGIVGQSLPAGDLTALVRAIKSGFAYVNVHTSTFPAGQVRGQIKSASR